MTFVGTFITGTLLKILTYSCGANPPGATPRLAWFPDGLNGFITLAGAVGWYKQR